MSLATLGLLVLANWAAGTWLSANTPNEGYRRIRRKWSMLRNMQSPVSTLILGDSSGAQGVDPSVLERTVGGKALNLCTVADMTVVNCAAMLDDHIRRVGPPRIVVLVHVYDLWDRDVSGYALAQTPLSPWSAGNELPWLPIAWKTRNEWLAGRYAPLFAESKSLAQAIRSWAVGGRGKPQSSGPRADGFSVALQPNPEQVRRDAAAHLRDYSKRRVRLSSSNRAALQKITELARRHRFKVALVNGPIFQGLWNDSGFRSYYRQVVAQVEAETSRSQDVLYLFKDPITFPDHLMTNVDHLTSEGAVVFTEAIGRELRAAGLQQQ